MNRRMKKTDINGWNEEDELILKTWADQATCFNWLHNHSHEKYYRINAYFTIPVIVISTLTGTANFAVDRLGDSAKNYAIMIIGAFNIIAAIISTVSQFLRIAEINEGHRIATIAWDKFGRNIKIELAKNPADRRSAGDMIKIYKEEFDRLVETSPKIKDSVIMDFNRVFKDSDIIKPEITGIITQTTVFDRKKIEWETIEEKKKQVNFKEEIEKFKRTYFETNGKFPNEAEISSHVLTLGDPNLNIDDISSPTNVISIAIDSPSKKTT